MNREQYNSDARYEKVFHNMELLGIIDITTNRQHKNGTIVWQLPIRVHTAPSITKFIEVASFSTGYVRNQNSGYSNYQLNKRCDSNPQYYPETKYNVDTNEHTKTGKYLKFTTRGCKLIPVEIDRLEYLISYCLKNYYIKNANQVAEGKYVSKWRYDNLADAARLDYENKNDELADFRNEDAKIFTDHYEKIQTLEENLDDAVCTIVKHETYYVKLEDKVRDLENKLDTIQRIAKYGEAE